MEKINFQEGTRISRAKVTIDGVDYIVTPATFSGATPLSAYVMNTLQTNVENSINQNADNIGGEEYDDTKTYEVGDIVKYGGRLYICQTTISIPEEFNPINWEETDVLSSAGGNEIAIGTSSDVTAKTKIWVDTDELLPEASEVVNSLEGNETTKAPSVNAVNNRFKYSTEEQVIGTWIDGKPLYRKTIVLPNGTGTTSEKTYNMSEFGLENIEMMSLESPSYYTLIGTGNIKTTFNFNYNDGNKYSVGFGITQKVIYVNLGYSYICNNECVITVIYTKTTD